MTQPRKSEYEESASMICELLACLGVKGDQRASQEPSFIYAENVFLGASTAECLVGLRNKPVNEPSWSSQPSVLCLEVQTSQPLGEGRRRQLDEFLSNHYKLNLPAVTELESDRGGGGWRLRAWKWGLWTEQPGKIGTEI